MNQTAKNRKRFTFEISELEGAEAIAGVRQLLLWTFPGLQPVSVDRVLARLPARFSGLMTAPSAERLRSGLQDLGARVALVDPDAGGAPAPEAPPAPAPESAPAEASPPAASGEARVPAAADAPESAPAEAGPPAAAAPPPPGPPEAPAASPGRPARPAPPTLAELRTTIARDRLDPTDTRLREAERIAEARAEEDREGPPAFFWSAWARALFTPRRFFASLREPGGSFRALLFAAVLGLLAGILSFPARMLAELDAGTVMRADLLERYLATLFTQPLAAVVATCVTAWLFHMGLRFLAGPRPFDVTLKVVAYTSAAAVFAAIPRAGESIAAFVALLLTLVGLSAAQRVTPMKAFGAVLFPLILIGFVLAMTLGGLALGSFLILEALGT